MARTELKASDLSPVKHPRCPHCAGAMWLIGIANRFDATPQLHFECKSCQAEAVIPPLEAGF